MGNTRKKTFKFTSDSHKTLNVILFNITIYPQVNRIEYRPMDQFYGTMIFVTKLSSYIIKKICELFGIPSDSLILLQKSWSHKIELCSSTVDELNNIKKKKKKSIKIIMVIVI